jgi:tol-pal system protein YbgF
VLQISCFLEDKNEGGNMKLFNIQRLTTISCLLFVLLIFGCASTKQNGDAAALAEEDFNLEELLGETEEQKTTDQQTKTSDAEEGEVLRLLGITKDEKTPPENQTLTKAEQTTADAGEQQALQNQINDLGKKIESKDVEIATLRTDLAAKEERMSQLENELQALRNKEAKPTTVTMAAPTSFKGRYQAALNEYESKQYQNAIQIFEELLNEDASNSLSDNCQYWIGECYYGLADYNQSILEFQKVFTFTESNKAADSQLKLGLCYLQLGDKVRAKEEFQRVIFDYPDSEYVALAQNYIDKL